MKSKEEKKNKVSYYTGWGLAYGAFAGGMMSVALNEYVAVLYLVGASMGAAIGTIYGQKKLAK